MDETQIKHVIEAALLAAGRPLSFEKIASLFAARASELERDTLQAALDALGSDYRERGLELKEVSSGYRIQVKRSMSEWLTPLWEERAPRYTRALLETLALVAYRQPITRAEIEDVRGVAVSTNIMRTLLERNWVRVVGHRDVPGKPAMFATTRDFLDYFGLKRLEDLPALAEIKEGLPELSPQADLIDALHIESELDDGEGGVEGEREGTAEAMAAVLSVEADAPGETDSPGEMDAPGDDGPNGAAFRDETDASGEADARNETDASGEADAWNETDVSGGADARKESYASDEMDTRDETHASDEVDATYLSEESAALATFGSDESDEPNVARVGGEIHVIISNAASQDEEQEAGGHEGNPELHARPAEQTAEGHTEEIEDPDETELEAELLLSRSESS